MHNYVKITQMDKQTDRQTDRKTNRYTDTQIDIEADTRQTHSINNDTGKRKPLNYMTNKKKLNPLDSHKTDRQTHNRQTQHRQIQADIYKKTGTRCTITHTRICQISHK